MDDNKDGRNLGARRNMRLVWTEISHGEGMLPAEVQSRLNRSKSEKGIGRPFLTKDAKKFSKRGHWQLHPVMRYILSLWKLDLIEETVCEGCPDCGKDHVEGWVVTPSSRRSEFPDPNICGAVHKEVCALWYGHPPPGSNK